MADDNDTSNDNLDNKAVDNDNDTGDVIADMLDPDHDLFGYGFDRNRRVAGRNVRPSLSMRFRVLTGKDIQRLDKEYIAGAGERRSDLEKKREQRAGDVSVEMYDWYSGAPEWAWDDEIQQALVNDTKNFKVRDGSGISGKTLLDFDKLQNDQDDMLIG